MNTMSGTENVYHGFRLRASCAMSGTEAAIWLSQSQAQRDEDLIYQTGLLRVWSIAALFHVRTRLIESFLGNADAVDQLSQDV